MANGAEYVDLRTPPRQGAAGVDEMTKRQEEHLRDLITKRYMRDDARVKALARLDRQPRLSKAKASEWITAARQLPFTSSTFAKAATDMPSVRDGRYAVELDGVLKFFRVKNGKDMRSDGGKNWEGFTFIDAGRGGPHDDLLWTAVKDLSYKKQIMTAIALDEDGAGRRFGREVGKCYVCGRLLTDDESRAKGIGPICEGG
jgi:hypothetical protein